MAKGGINPKQELFIEAYLGEAKFNATEAARIAGYGQPQMHGSRLMKNAEIASRVRERLDEAAMKADEVLAELAAIARAPWKDFLAVEMRDGQPVGATLLLKDKIRALELLGKHHKLFVEKQEITGPNNGPLMPTLTVVIDNGNSSS